jgi:hypothetical protein
MKIQTLLEKVLTGRKVHFSEEEVLSGPYKNNRVIVVEDLENNNKYVLYRSLTNYIRFQRWIGKSARADIAPIKKTRILVKSGYLKLIRISTVVNVEKIKRHNKDNEDWEYNYGISTTWEPEDVPDIRQGHAGTE